DPVAGTFATDETNKRLAERKGLPLGGLPDQLASLLSAHALRKALGTDPDLSSLTFEAVLLEEWLVTYFLRAARAAAEGVPATSLGFVPNQLLNFGVVISGEESPTRRALLVNSGQFPISLGDVQVVGSNEFVIVSPVAWPKIVASGSAEILDLRFRPQGV